MNSMSQNGARKPARQRDGAKCTININRNRIMEGKSNAIYRESPHALSSISGNSTRQSSTCSDSDYRTSFGDLRRDRCGRENSKDEIAERLSKLKIGEKQNFQSDSGTGKDLTSEDDLKANSIIAGISPAQAHYSSVQSIADSRFSIILAGRLDSKDDLFADPDEHSLLNNAINESVETNNEYRSDNAEISRFVDSLEVHREEVSSSRMNERDSLEAGDYYVGNKSGNQNGEIFVTDNDENSNPNILDPKKRGQPRIISDKIISPASMIPRTLGRKLLTTTESKKLLDVENSNYSEPTTNKYDSSMAEDEKLVIADIKTPNVKAIRFIEDCCKSSPIVGVNADTFGTDFITDISNLSALGNNTDIESYGKNIEADKYRDNIIKRFSQQFAEAPTKFTEKLLTLFEESILVHSKQENPDISGVSLSRLTEEFRKICQDYGKNIEDESMPEFGFGLSFNVSTPPTPGGANNSGAEATAVSPFHNFSKSRGGKKVYRKTPIRVLQMKGGTHCNTPNCANALHRAKNNNLYSPNGDYDSTATFEFWENLCYEMSPAKPTKSKLSRIEDVDVPAYEDLIRKSDQQMASLDQSLETDLRTDKEQKSDSNENNLTTTSKDCQDHINSMRQKFIGNLSSSLVNGGDQAHEIEQIITAGLLEKRRKCFEEARKVFETKEKFITTKSSKSSDKVKSEFIDKKESVRDRDHEARFVSTLSACVDYFEHVKTLQNHKLPLHSIMECSETSESLKDYTNNLRPTEYVEAVILPLQNRGKYEIENTRIQKLESTPKNINLIAKTCLYIPGSPAWQSNVESLSKSPRGPSRLSPIRRLSPGAQVSSVVSKKIKSPISPARKRSLRVAKPASHANVPRTPSKTPKIHISRNKQNTLSGKSETESTPRIPSNKNLKSSTHSPRLMDVTNIKKTSEIPKLTVTSPSPSCNSQQRSDHWKIVNKSTDMNCQKQLNFSGISSPELKINRYFYTPERTATHVKARPKKKYFGTPKGKQCPNKLPSNSPSSYVFNYKNIQSPVGMYIRGTDRNLIKNVIGTNNERMLTPRAKTPQSKSKVSSPILARSPCMSPQPEASKLKFQLTPARSQNQKQASDILNVALCESDPSSLVGSESTSHSPFPKVFYKPAPCVKMNKDDPPHSRCPKYLARGMEEKIIYRHEGRLKSATESKIPNRPADGSTENSSSCDSRDVSLLHERPAVKSYYLHKK